MTKLSYIKTKLPGSNVKPAVQKRVTRNEVGYISKKMLPLYFRVLSWIFSQDKKVCLRFARSILSIWDHNGAVHLVSYLKTCFLLVQKYTSGNNVESTNGFPLSLVGGLPRIIPGPLRSEIRKDNPVAIRMVLTSLAVFRIIKCPGKLKLETITGPFTGISETLPDYELSRALRSIFGRAKSLKDLSAPKHLFLMAAGPNSSVSWKGTWLDIMAWSKSPLLPTLTEFIQVSGWKETSFARTLADELRYCSELGSVWEYPVLGRLAQKEEAAGKIRVFAITDSITQALLHPLHEFLFGMLRKLPTDGTFDQGAPLDRLLDLKRRGEFGPSKFWSYDLSAATDRLPARLHAQVLNLLFGDAQYGDLWRRLLCDRPWNGLFYKVGQPMGALSSWAMLAVTHHTIVSVAASRVGIKDFDHYALLGDDIVIAHDAVAQSYHTLMTEILGVEINLSKSLVSSTHFEYAKRLVSVDHELSPLGPANILIYFRSPYGIISILRDAIAKGFVLDEPIWDSMSQTLPLYGKRLAAKLEWVIKGPFGLVPTEAGLSSQLRLHNALTPVDIDILSSSIDHTIHSENVRRWENSLATFNKVVRAFELRVPVDTYLTYGRAHSQTDDRSRLPRIWGEYPDFRRYSVNDSRLFFLMRETILSMEDRILEDKPVRRFLFNGPLVMTNHYRADWLGTVMSWICSKIHDWEVIVPAMDPFKADPLSNTTRSHQRGHYFFRAVHREFLDRKLTLRRRY